MVHGGSRQLCVPETIIQRLSQQFPECTDNLLSESTFEEITYRKDSEALTRNKAGHKDKEYAPDPLPALSTQENKL